MGEERQGFVGVGFDRGIASGVAHSGDVLNGSVDGNPLDWRSIFDAPAAGAYKFAGRVISDGVNVVFVVQEQLVVLLYDCTALVEILEAKLRIELAQGPIVHRNCRLV